VKVIKAGYGFHDKRLMQIRLGRNRPWGFSRRARGGMRGAYLCS
jgi:hypothetical protein